MNFYEALFVVQRSGCAELHGELNERGEGGRLRDGAGRLRARVLQANKMKQNRDNQSVQMI
jgi:hypothetical protein